jgi:hypothetical protein
MVGGISAALGGLSTSALRFERAAGRLGAATGEGGGSDAAIAGGATATSDAMVQMAVARFSFMASLRAASATNEMLAETLRLGDPGR